MRRNTEQVRIYFEEQGILMQLIAQLAEALNCSKSKYKVFHDGFYNLI